MNKPGILILIPCTLGDTSSAEVIPENNLNYINSCSTFIVENIRTARRFLIKSGISSKIDDLTFHTLNKHTKVHEFESMLNSIFSGENIGLLSEAGCPGVADPGSEIVKIAHRLKLTVKPLVGPSSILLAIMASGMNGQRFSFNGYLPKEKQERVKQIKQLEQLSFKNRQTQLFIETPFRNQHVLEDICKYCHPDTMVTIASELSTKNESILSLSVKDLKHKKLNLNKKPTVFLIQKY
ncbi:MAG: SAM-dependent methyltransferase [Flavobacteriales bacterium]